MTDEQPILTPREYKYKVRRIGYFNKRDLDLIIELKVKRMGCKYCWNGRCNYTYEPPEGEAVDYRAWWNFWCKNLLLRAGCPLKIQLDYFLKLFKNVR